jgi:hypothetical protein
MSVNSTVTFWGLFNEDLASKLVFFVIHDMIIFQGMKTGVIMQLIEKHVPFVTRVHYMAHRCNLAMQTPLTLPLVVKIKALLQSMCVYFSHTPKKHMQN